MKKQPFVSVVLAGMSLTSFGMKIPSPFCLLSLNNSEVDNYTKWELSITVGGDSSQRINIAAFEALIYSAAQASGYNNASGIPVEMVVGWMNEKTGSVGDHASYRGWTINYSASVSGRFMKYTLTGYASQIMKTNTPVINVPALTGFVQPSAVVEAIAKAVKATDYYDLDIDRCDSPTLISHNAMTTSFTSYIRGDKTGEDDFQSFPGLVTLSKSYNSSREAAGITGARKLSTILNNVSKADLPKNFKKSFTDSTLQSATFAFWIDEPSMTHPGMIHYKCTESIMCSNNNKVLKYGTSDSNVLSLSGSYNGIAYNMADMRFSTLGFSLDGSGNTIGNNYTVTNSWSNSLAKVYQTANIINDINALATQFSGEFSVTIPGSVKGYSICEPVSLIVMSGNTLSPISGIYNIKSVGHTISNTFVTELKLQRMSISSANQTAAGMGIFTSGSSSSKLFAYNKTANVISTSKVDFGTIYPTWNDIMES